MLGVWSRHAETTQSFCSGFRPTHNSHCSLLGNETTDNLAKELGTNREQEDINNLQRSQVHHQQGSTASGENLIHIAAYPAPSYHAYSFTVNIRTVSTHVLWSSYNHTRVHSISSFKATTQALTVQATTSRQVQLDSQNSVLVCCQTGSITTTEQLLQINATFTHNLRRQVWPVETPVARKLFGNLDDLLCTAVFVQRTGVSGSVWVTDKKKKKRIQ